MQDFRRDVCIYAAILLGTGVFDTANLAEANVHSDSILDLSQLTVRMNDESVKGKIGCYLTVVEKITDEVLTMRAVRAGKVGVSEKIVSWIESIDALGVTERIDFALNENVGMEKIDEAFKDVMREPDTLGGFLSCSDAMDPVPGIDQIGSFCELELEDQEGLGCFDGMEGLCDMDWSESTVSKSESEPESTTSASVDGNEGSEVRKTVPRCNI